MDVLPNSSLILITVILTPVLYVVYNVYIFMKEVRRRGKAVDQFPGEPKHWLWGHLHLYPGPNEAGLARGREMTMKYPLANGVWRGPVDPVLFLRHPNTLKTLLMSSGVVMRNLNDATLALLRMFQNMQIRVAITEDSISVNRSFRDMGEAGLASERELAKKYPRVVPIYYGPVGPCLWLHHPESLTNLLRSSEPKPLGIGVYRYAKPWIGDGLLVSRGQKWARNRRLLSPAFHFDILKPYTVVNNEAAEKLVNKIAKYTGRGESFEFYSNISLCTFDVILRCAMSYEDNIQEKGESHPYVQAVSELGELWVKRVLSPWLASDFVYYLTSQGRTFKKHCDFVHSISENLIRKRQNTLKEKGADAMRKGRYLDFLDILLSAKDSDGKGLTHQEIRDEVDTFLFEGHDTTASSISWAIYSMAENQEWQRKCQEEIDGILEGRDTDVIEWEDFPKLKNVTMCIKEAMRLHGPVPFVERELTKEMEIDGKKVPPGSILSIHIYNLHHNPTVWEEPMEFRPERFSSENKDRKDNYSFIPFSAGPRNCIGQHFAMHEQKVVVSRILRRFHIELDPTFKVEKKISVVMRTQNGMKLKVTPRKIH